MPLHANQLRAQFFSFIEVLACPQFLLVDIVMADDIQPGRLVYACGASSALIVNIESQLEFDLLLGSIGSLGGLKRSFVRLDDYAPEMAYKRVTFILKQVFCRLIGMAHCVVHYDTCLRRRTCKMLARSYFCQTQQECSYTPSTKVWMYTCFHVDTHVFVVVYTDVANKLPFISDNHSGINCQVEARLLPGR